MFPFLVFGFSLFFVFQTSQSYQYEIKKFTVPVDHFSFATSQTFEIRYLINDTYWKESHGPIFFYTGNEGDIELFANNTGFIWETAPKFKALVVFAEHRYYGKSLPFGNNSFSDPKYTGYLTSQQALADYVDLLKNLSSDGQSPVIAFGGSYGGMLAAYMRMKYPHAVAGAIAASAPIWQFTGMTPCEAFTRIVTSDYLSVNQSCSDSIRSSWKAIRDVTSIANGLEWLSKEWKLCQPLTTANDIQSLIDWLNNVYINLAMVDYPYATNFLANLPAYPIRAVCQHLQDSSLTGKALLSQIYKALSVYTNYTGESKCVDIGLSATDSLGDEGWYYQSCTEMVMPQCSDGVEDMFEADSWNFEKFSDDCFNKWKVRPQADLAEKIYGGKRIEAASNIIFSNGLLDPWSSGGVLKDINKSLITVLIPGGAHHLDLRESNPADPAEVKLARNKYNKYIYRWIKDHYNEKNIVNFIHNVDF